MQFVLTHCNNVNKSWGTVLFCSIKSWVAPTHVYMCLYCAVGSTITQWIIKYNIKLIKTSQQRTANCSSIKSNGYC